MDFQFRALSQADGDRALAYFPPKRRALDGRWMACENGGNVPHTLGRFKAESLEAVAQSRLPGGLTTAGEAFYAGPAAGRKGGPGTRTRRRKPPNRGLGKGL